MSNGTLYLVATPIGNLEDITYRALRILKEVDIIAAEDTRQTLKLLNYYNITKHLISYHRHNEEIKYEMLLKKLLEGKNIAIVTDAGTPGISDPGEVIVKHAIENDISIVPIPGPCALINALICSGINTQEFSFYGFLPTNKKLRRQKLEEIKEERKTIIIYEAPHRILQTLNELKIELGNRNIAIAKELTKVHEFFLRGSFDDVIQNIGTIKGEYVLIIEGTQVQKENTLSYLTLDQHYDIYEKQGYTKKEIIKKISKDRSVNKNEIYQYFLKK